MNMKHSKIKQTANRAIQCLAVLGTAGLCLPAIGQDSEQPETGEPVPAAEQGAQRSPVQFMVGGSHQFNSDIDNGGDFSLSRFRTGVGVPVHFNDQWSLTTTLKYELGSYNFGGGVDPWNNINTLSGVALLQYRLDEHWLLYGGPIVRFSTESGASWSDGKQGGGLIAVNYIVDDTLSFGGGIVAISQIENSATALPILTANWKFADDWKLNLGFTDLATAGYGVGVSWDCCPEWQLTFGGQAHKSRFRIDGSGTSVGGVGQDKAFVLTAGATWTPCKTFSGTAFVGGAAGGELRLENCTGSKIDEQNYDPAPIVGLKATFRF